MGLFVDDVQAGDLWNSVVNLGTAEIVKTFKAGQGINILSSSNHTGGPLCLIGNRSLYRTPCK